MNDRVRIDNGTEGIHVDDECDAIDLACADAPMQPHMKITIAGGQAVGKSILADWLAVQMTRRGMHVTVDGEQAHRAAANIRPFRSGAGKVLHNKTVDIVTRQPNDES